MFGKWIDEQEREDWLKDFENNEVVSVREWVATLMLMVVPVVNVVMLFVWAFSNKELTPANKVNWARGSLIVLTALLLSVALVVGFCFLAMYIHNYHQ